MPDSSQSADKHWAPLRNDDDLARPRGSSWAEYSSWLVNEWSGVLNSATLETTIQRYLERHPCLLPGGAPEDGPGHHGAWYDAVISQPELVSSRQRRVPDFMWLRRDTAANRPVCLEIEQAGKDWYTLGGHPTAELTQAIDQIDDWRAWFAAGTNAQQFNEAYVPAEFRHRGLLPRFILVFGRDAEFRVGQSRHDDPEWLRSKRDALARPDLQLMTFDMLRPSYDLKDAVTLTGRLPKFQVVGVPPTLQTGPGLSTELLIRAGNPSAAIAAAPLLTDERRAYLKSRWDYWRSKALGESRPREPSQAE